MFAFSWLIIHIVVPTPEKDCRWLWLMFQQPGVCGRLVIFGVFEVIDSANDFHTGCQNINHNQQRSFSGLHQPGRSTNYKAINTCYHHLHPIIFFRYFISLISKEICLVSFFMGRVMLVTLKSSNNTPWKISVTIRSLSISWPPFNKTPCKHLNL